MRLLLWSSSLELCSFALFKQLQQKAKAQELGLCFHPVGCIGGQLKRAAAELQRYCLCTVCRMRLLPLPETWRN